jgi:hypothetical protein
LGNEGDERLRFMKVQEGPKRGGWWTCFQWVGSTMWLRDVIWWCLIHHKCSDSQILCLIHLQRNTQIDSAQKNFRHCEQMAIDCSRAVYARMSDSCMLSHHQIPSDQSALAIVSDTMPSCQFTCHCDNHDSRYCKGSSLLEKPYPDLNALWHPPASTKGCKKKKHIRIFKNLKKVCAKFCYSACIVDGETNGFVQTLQRWCRNSTVVHCTLLSRDPQRVSPPTGQRSYRGQHQTVSHDIFL